MLWLKYSPKQSSEVIGQDVGKVKQAVTSNKPALIYGPPGTGKTATAYAIAEELGYELLEFNASDERGACEVNDIIGNACRTNSLFGKRLILVDDVDAISDRGGLPELVKQIKKSLVPVILTATDIWSTKLKSLRDSCVLVEYKNLRVTQILSELKRISSIEGLNLSNDSLYRIAGQAGGDLRAAINDLELLKHSGDEADSREKQVNIFTALQRLFKSSSFSDALRSFDNIDMDLPDLMLWVSENIPNEYKDSVELARAFDCLSRADVFLGRIRRWQYWRFLTYANTLLTAGVSAAKDLPKKCFTPYKKPTRILKLWLSKSSRETAKSISEKLGSKCHLSIKKARKEILPFLRLIIRSDYFRDKISSQLELNPKELEFIS